MTILLKCLAGSKAYNLATSTSDDDIRGVCFKNDLDHILGFKHFEQMTIQNDEQDIVMWSLQRFVDLAFKCNTNALDVLFAHKDSYLSINEFGQVLLDNKYSFLSDKLYSVLRGYYQSEYKKVLNLPGSDLGDKRKKHMEEFGYSIKNASHCIRLMNTGIVAFETGMYPVYLDGEIKDTIMKIKTGAMSKIDFECTYKYMETRFEDAHRHSRLPAHAENDKIMKLVKEYICDVIKVML